MKERARNRVYGNFKINYNDLTHAFPTTYYVSEIHIGEMNVYLKKTEMAVHKLGMIKYKVRRFQGNSVCSLLPYSLLVFFFYFAVKSISGEKKQSQPEKTAQRATTTSTNAS